MFKYEFDHAYSELEDYAKAKGVMFSDDLAPLLMKKFKDARALLNMACLEGNFAEFQKCLSNWILCGRDYVDVASADLDREIRDLSKIQPEEVSSWRAEP